MNLMNRTKTMLDWGWVLLTLFNALVQRQLNSIAEGVEVCNLTGDIYYLHVYVCSVLVTSRFLEFDHGTHWTNLWNYSSCQAHSSRGEVLLWAKSQQLAIFWWVCDIWEMTWTPFSFPFFSLISFFGYISIYYRIV